MLSYRSGFYRHLSKAGVLDDLSSASGSVRFPGRPMRERGYRAGTRRLALVLIERHGVSAARILRRGGPVPICRRRTGAALRQPAEGSAQGAQPTAVRVNYWGL